MRRLLPAPICLAALATLAAGQAPAGFRSVADEVTGLVWFAPKDYTEIPLSPTEQALRARYVRNTLPDEILAEKLTNKPQIQVFAYRALSGGVTPSGTETAPPPDEKAPKTIREAMEMAGEVHTFEEFCAKRLRGFKVTAVRGKDGTYDIVPEKEGSPWVGVLIRKDEGSWSFGVLGMTVAPHLARMKATLAVMAQSLRFPPEAARKSEASHEEAELDRLYPPGRFRAAEHRKSVRRGLARGWKAIDTESYILVSHSDDEKLVNKIARDIEAMRALYRSLFPPVQETDKVSIVRICRNRAEYLAYGGPEMAGGHWHPGNEELVFYDYDQTTLDNERSGIDARKTTDKDSLLVLYHEAFHQYIHYAVGEIAPHDWFNEGHGDYFSGAQIPQYGTKVERIGPMPWRIHRAKDQCELGKNFIPLQRLVNAEREEYYGPLRSDFYAAGWSFVYFLRESEKVRKHPRWSQMLDDYFDALKAAYRDEMASKGKDATLADKTAAQRKARTLALKAFLEDVDLDALEAEWKSFIVKLKDPWPDRRKR